LPLLWRRRTQSLEKIGESGLLIGVRPNEVYDETEFSFESGDRLLLYTDGLIEAENALGESFGDAALPTLINQHINSSPDQFADLLLREVQDWSLSGPGKGQEDDITIVVLDLKDGREDHAVRSA
jgi:sigma-B regulation protein RsbU (phosphoserine phosphatase)